MLLTKAAEGFLLQKSVEGLSPRTLETYEHQLHHMAKFLGDPDITSITTHDLKRFFHYLRNEYTPPRWNGTSTPLAGRTLRNYWIVCRSFYTWAEAELGVPDAINGIAAPKPNTIQVEPFTQEEVKAMLQATRSPRDHTLLLVLLDTGIRASELCALKVADVDLKTGEMNVQGKGKKERCCYLGDVARRSLWKYLDDREPREPLFITQQGRALNIQRLWQVVVKIGKRAGIANAHPHRFRHTFAVQFLRNGGDIFTLQMLLGHSSLAMVRHYAALAAIDAEQAHRRASPADHWLR
jgi:integrase/recombinase XerD